MRTAPHRSFFSPLKRRGDRARALPSSIGRVAFGLILPAAGCAPQGQRGPVAPTGTSTREVAPAVEEASPADRWETVARLLERRGAEHDGVYTVTIPRDDWNLAIEGMPVPAAAGVASVMHFYVCPCGKTTVVGQLCVAEHEVNDVIDALRAGRIEIASVAPMLLHTRPQPLVIRFQAEGKTADLSKTLREAIRWTGKERMAPEPGSFGK
jgi:hypothetical protein